MSNTATQTESATLTVISNKPAGPDPVLSKLAISRFESTFKLEGELVGKGRVKVSKKGGVTMSLKSLTSRDGESLALATGLKGDALEACRQQLAKQLKTEFGVIAARLTGDARYEGGKGVILPNGNVSLEWKLAKPETIIAVTEDQAMRVLGLTPDELAKIQLDREEAQAKSKAIADGKAKVELATAVTALQAMEDAQVEEMQKLEASGASPEAIAALEAQQVAAWELATAAAGLTEKPATNGEVKPATE